MAAYSWPMLAHPSLHDQQLRSTLDLPPCAAEVNPDEGSLLDQLFEALLPDVPMQYSSWRAIAIVQAGLAGNTGRRWPKGEKS